MKEEEIRPQEVFDEYLRLAKIDIDTYFKDVPNEHIQCPACNSEGDHSFHKSGFDYSLCPDCNTLYVSPRPEKRAFNNYYTEAPSVEYWATTFYETTADARREKLWKPKAKLIQNAVQSFATDAKIIDVGGGYGIFAEEIKSLTGKDVTVIEPSPYLAKICRGRGINVIEKFLEDLEDSELPPGRRAFVSFELFEHLHDPTAFLKDLRKLMQPGDLFLFTTLSGTGVDIQVLWENSKSISPPHHLNFLNPVSVKILLERLNFSEVAVTTPGRLDIDILCNNRNLIRDRFWQTFADKVTELERSQWQDLVSVTGFSSHMMVCCRKSYSKKSKKS